MATLPKLPGLSEEDFKTIEAVASVADDRYSGTIRAIAKECRRLQESNEHLKRELHQALNMKKVPYKKGVRHG